MSTDTATRANGAAAGASGGAALYARLSEPFAETHRDTRGGVTFDYVTGEQVTSRLNDVLGADGWAFRVLEHGIHEQADEVWVLAEVTAEFDRATVIRQQFGSQKVKRSRQSGAPLDIGFDLKGATTDALKKCATLLGVGLYLSHKEGLQRAIDPPAQPAQTNAERVKAELKARVEELQLLAAAQGVALPDATRCATVGDVKQWIADAKRALPEAF